MKWQRYALVGALVAGLGVGCGGDDVADNQNQNQNQEENQNQNQNQGEPDEFAEAVDVWIGAETNTADTATLVEVGESFGGRFDEAGEHHFSLNLSAGDVLTLSVDELEAGAAAAGVDQLQVVVTFPLTSGDSGDTSRFFLPQNHDEREIFITRSGDHVIRVDAVGGEEAGFAFTTGLGELDAGSGEVPGTQIGDLSDALLDAYSFSLAEDSVFNAEVFALRPPVESELDSALILWDADAGATVAENDFISQENFDSAFTVDAEGGTNYVLIVDSWANTADAAYEMVTTLFASSPTSPIELSAGDTFEGTILDVSEDFYSDYFLINVEPGDYKLVTVDGHNDLEPSMVVFDLDLGEFNVRSLPVGNEAGATLGVPESADEGKTYLIRLSDHRNFGAEEGDEYLGGDSFDYIIAVEAVEPDVLELGADSEATFTLGSVGDLVLFDVDLGDGHLLWMTAQHDVDLEDEDLDPMEAGILPAWSLNKISTTEFSQIAASYYWGVSDTASLLLRDAFFRGGPDFETEVRLVAFDVLGQEYGDDIALDDDNGTFEDATVLELPAQISGSFTVGEVESEDEIPTHYFRVTLEAGDILGMTSENSVDMESIFTIVDEDDEEINGGNYLLEQFQVTSGEDEYWDRALILEVEEAGEYTVKVRPFCYRDGTCETGDVTLRAFVHQGEAEEEDNTED